MSATKHKILQDAAVETGAYQRRVSPESSVAAREELESKMQINDVPPATLARMRACAHARMRELTAAVAEKFAATYDPAVVRLYPAEVRATAR